MKINRIRLQRFGCFADQEINFQPGLNIIKGPNEAGKSTLHQALLLALLERPSQKNSNQPFCAWGADGWYCLAIEFDDEAGQPWFLVKDFQNMNAELFDPIGRSTKNITQIQDTIAAHLGTSSLGIFKSTVCVAQDAMTDVSSGQKEIAQSLEGIITGGNENSNTASTIKKLESKITEYNRGVLRHAERNPGPIARLRQEYKDLDEQIRRDGGALRAQEQDEQELKKTTEELASIDGQLQTKYAVREKAEKIKGLQQKSEEWVEKEATLAKAVSQIAEAEGERAGALKVLEDLQPLSDLTDDERQEVEALQQEVRDLTREKEQTAELIAKYEAGLANRAAEATEPAPKPSMLPTALIIAGLAAGAVGIIALLNQNLLGGIAGLLGGLALLAFGIYQLAGRRGALSSAARDTSGVLELPAFDEERLADAEKALAERLAALKCDSMADLAEKWAAITAARGQRATAEGKLAVLLPDDKSRDDLEAERQEASREMSRIRDQLNDPQFERAAALDAIAYQELIGGIERLENRQHTLNETRLRLTGRVDKEPVSREALLQAEDQLAGIQEALDRAKERLAVYKLMLETMVTAREKTLTRASDEIAPKLADYFSSLTIGRYQIVEVDSDLNIKVQHPAQPQTRIKPQQLSSGSQDQLYLAARLTLSDLLFRAAKPPIFLDDPFVKFDPQRRQAAVELCQKVAEERQVLLFTCADHYDSAGQLIELAGTGI